MPIPLILAPAGNKDSFLAALAAGADAIYCGVTEFSARRQARNLALTELQRLIQLAHTCNTQVYVTLNALIRPDEVSAVKNLIQELCRREPPDAIIVQDLGVPELARQAGYQGDIHLSTLANCSFPAALPGLVRDYGIRRVVLPRELNLDEIKIMAQDCPPELDLEVFVHGALCYGVSGRCYWSSYMGGKSGLRGLCVQPCRRFYTQDKRRLRHFSCRDLSLDVLVKVLATIPQVRVWKIEGRKKGPHYVYYTVKAYQRLRAEGHLAPARKDALDLLGMALGRDATHGGFLPQRPQTPLEPGRQTASGLFVGKLQGGRQRPWLMPRTDLLAGDMLRVGYEDQPGHIRQRVNRNTPQKGRYYINFPANTPPITGTPVFLVDRREPALLQALAAMEAKLRAIPEIPEPATPVSLPPQAAPSGTGFRSKTSRIRTIDIPVYRDLQNAPAPRGAAGAWLTEANLKACPIKQLPHIWWWLPPVMWPADEARLGPLIHTLDQHKARQVVLNAPWQQALFKANAPVKRWAGPFCNISNTAALHVLARNGFAGAIVSPELTRRDYSALTSGSPLPLGIVIAGNWPLCISRLRTDAIALNQPFNSPRQESAWATAHDGNYWLFPNWRLDFSTRRQELSKAGYTHFFTLVEPLPAQVPLKDRPGDWNWEQELV